MRNLWLVVALGAALLLTGCARKSFEQVQVQNGKSALYVYWLEPVNQENATYDVYVDGELAGVVHNHSYIVTQVKQGQVTVTVQNSDPVKASLERSVIQLDTSGSTEHYIKIKTPFNVKVPDASLASEEIKSAEQWDDIGFSVRMPGEPKKGAAAVAQPSAAEEIERLLDLKNKGAITEEEYQILKARVIGK
jgi:hypothetical protein